MFKTLLRRLISHPWVYNQIQVFCDLRQHRLRLAPHLADAGHKTVLDIGAGTGMVVPLLPGTARYIWLDNDPQNLKWFRPGNVGCFAVISDAAHICFGDKCADLALCVNMSHHLSDEHLQSLLSGLARVTRERLIFLDALVRPDSVLSRFLWRCDRGSYPRSEQELCSTIERWFEIEQKEFYRANHYFLLCVCRPKRQ